jgi:hypothetical protein
MEIRFWRFFGLCCIGDRGGGAEGGAGGGDLLVKEEGESEEVGR